MTIDKDKGRKASKRTCLRVFKRLFVFGLLVLALLVLLTPVLASSKHCRQMILTRLNDSAAGQTDFAGQWKQVREDCHPKENYYDAYLKQRRMSSFPYGVREALGREAAKNYSRIRQLCPEDVQALENRIRAVLV